MPMSVLLERVTVPHLGSDVPALVPVDRIGVEELRKVAAGREVKVTITNPRNPKFHRLFFALINVVFEAQHTFASIEGMLDALKMAVGHCDERIAVTGTKFYVPRSISFDRMDETEFRQFARKVIDVIVTKILPGVGREDVEQRVYDILGEPGPKALTDRR